MHLCSLDTPERGALKALVLAALLGRKTTLYFRKIGVYARRLGGD